MRYALYLFFAFANSLYGANPHVPATIALPDYPAVCTVDSYTCMTLPSEHCIRTTGGGLLVAAFLTGFMYGYPVSYPANIYLGSMGCCGICMLGSAKPLANKNCTMYYCYPHFCKERLTQQQPLPEIPTVPEPIAIEPALATITPHADEQQL